MLSKRIQELHEVSLKRGAAGQPSHFYRDYHASALGQYAPLPHGEKLARAMAYAIENIDVICKFIVNSNDYYYYNKTKHLCQEFLNIF